MNHSHYPPARVTLVLRTPVEEGSERRYAYKPLSLGAGRDYALVTADVPLPGDLITGSDRNITGGAARTCTWVVTGRRWTYPEYGSIAYPVDSTYPVDGPMVDVFVELASGPYSDEAGDGAS